MATQPTRDGRLPTALEGVCELFGAAKLVPAARKEAPTTTDILCAGCQGWLLVCWESVEAAKAASRTGANGDWGECHLSHLVQLASPKVAFCAVEQL